MLLEIKWNILTLLSGKIILHCFHIWISAWHAKGDIMTPVGFGILALVKNLYSNSRNFCYVLALTRDVNVPLYFLGEKYLSNRQTYCRGSKKMMFLTQDHQKIFLYFYFITLPFPSTLNQRVWEETVFPRHLFHSRIKLFRSGPPSKDQPATNTPSIDMERDWDLELWEWGMNACIPFPLLPLVSVYNALISPNPWPENVFIYLVTYLHLHNISISYKLWPPALCFWSFCRIKHTPLFNPLLQKQ